MKRRNLAALCGAFVLSANPVFAAPQSAGEVSGGMEYFRDMPYYPQSMATDEISAECRLDLRRPVGVSGFPTVVWLHGGGLTRGRRNFTGVDFYDKGIAAVAVDYRLMGESNSVRAAECISDAAAAVAWTLDHIAEYGGDPKKVFVSGSSAGGYLTFMLGMDPRWLAKFGHRPLDLAGLAPNSGQPTTHFNVKKFNGDTRPRWQPMIDEWAPLNYCENWKEIPPIVVICGEPPWEMKGRAEECKLLVASLRALGHRKAWYVSLPYASHGRTTLAGAPYIEYFVKGNYPEPLENSVK